MEAKKEESDLSKIMKSLTEVVNSYLSQTIDGKKFKGTITIEFNCQDGGIGNVSTTVKKNYSKMELV